MSDPAKNEPVPAQPVPVRSVSEQQASSETRFAMPDQRWMIHPALKDESQWLSHQIGLSPLLAQVLLNRGIQTPEAAVAFINPESLQLPSPLDEFPDLEPSIEILLQAIELQQKIAICGDYDADGMTSTALLMRALRYLGADVDYAIPSRMQEGYGINDRIIEEFYADGVSVILTVDNGIAAVEPIAYARELGMTVIVTDHHDAPPQIPPAHAILNPKLIAESSPYRGVAGVGVAYILAVCLARAMGRIQDLTAPLLELFTLGTIADLAPLTGVNRRWVRRGLRLLPKSRLIGVQALIQVAGLGEDNDTLKPEDIGFRLGPRINAVGRLGDPQVVIEMLTTDDVDVALERALQCEQANQQRREMCDRIETEAIDLIEAQLADGNIDLLRDRVLLIIQPAWHHGVIGIVASRLVERYGVPVFIGTYEDAEQKEIRGSARGIVEFNVFEALQSCHDLMDKFGGHQAAGGFSFPAKHLRQVKSRLVNFANQMLAPKYLKPLITVDVRAALNQLTYELFEQIDALHPCGIGNPEPVFWTPSVRVVEQRAIGQNKTHLKLAIADEGGDIVEAIAWRWGSYCPLPSRLDIAYKLKLNEWQGNTTIQLEIVGVRPPAQLSSPAQPSSQPSLARTSLSPTLKLPLEGNATATMTAERSPQSVVREVSPEVAALPQGDRSAVDSFYGDIGSSKATKSVSQANFFYSHRRYQARILKKGTARELQIHNPEGQVLKVLLPERQGYLCLPGEAPRPVNIGEAHYFNLIRGGLDALEIRQKTHLLLEKDELLADKDQHIATLTQQVKLLQAQAGQVSSDQKQQLQDLQAEAEAQETAIQNQEAHIQTLQQQLSRPAPTLDPKAIKRSVRTAVGDKVWYCLQTQSQKALYAAYKQVALYAADGTDVATADYSEAGIRLGQVVEQEVLQPWLEDLGDYLSGQGKTQIGDVKLSKGRQYPLKLAAPLLAETWQTVQLPLLQTATPPNTDQLYVIARAQQPLSPGDRALLNTFFEQWEHPLSAWLSANPEEAATYLDQIAQCQQLSGQASVPLYFWGFELMRDLVIGQPDQMGLFQHIYDQA